MKTSPNKDLANSSEEEIDLRRGLWTLEEDTLLIHYITTHGEGRWNLLAKSSGLKRTGKSCRLRWLNYLKPDIKRGNLTPQEQLLILELHSKWGNRWSKIAQHLPGRTDNEIKNYWRTRVQKQARQLKIDSNSKRFVEALRHFWMPRLLEKVEQISPSPSSSSCSVSSISTMETQKSPSPFPETKQARIGILSSTAGEPNKKEDNNWNCHGQNSSPSLPEQPRNSEHQTHPSPHDAHGISTAYNNSLPEDCYFVDISHFDMEGFDQSEMPSRAAAHPVSASDSHMAEADWIGDDLASTFWNMDELWQLRK